MIDKQKTDDHYTSELVNVKTGECHRQSFTVDAEQWQTATAPLVSKTSDTDIDTLNQDLLDKIASSLELSLQQQKAILFLTHIDFNGFCERLIKIIRRYQ